MRIEGARARVFCGQLVGRVSALTALEASEEATARRLRESARVEERERSVTDLGEFRAAEAAADGKLLVVQVQSDEVCETGWDDERQEQEDAYSWQDPRNKSREEIFKPCGELKHVFQRCARDCPDVTFLNLYLDGSPEAEGLREHLGVTTVPSLVFRKEGRKVWEHKGAMGGADQNLGEGLLFYGDSAAGGAKASDYVEQMSTVGDVEAFVAKQPEGTLSVVQIAQNNAVGCIRIYPAMLALAKNLQGLAVFGRLMAEGAEGRAAMELLKVKEVPTFLFYRNGKEVGRHVGSSRGDLIGQVMLQQSNAGMPMPAPKRR